MRIATWNVERLKHKAKLDEILFVCEQVKADILVLTETDVQLKPNDRYCFQTPKLGGNQPVNYKPTENRVSIFTNYRCVKQHTTYDEYTALCVELETERGNLLVYGTIIGIYGNRHPSFHEDLSKQLDDFRRLSSDGNSLCVCGDFNCSFADNYYYTKFGRSAMIHSFSENHIELLTMDRPECIDHIAISEKFVDGVDIDIEEWNKDKNLSDHSGIAVSLIWNGE
ncbi:hypothetical protein FACS1894111_11810 [Clostridia bacterium]|nr:hypothetical protein FACS1894111_11810 [Clostridia bacterium]